jgi:hypothetical protein
MAMFMQRFGNHRNVRALTLGVVMCAWILFGSTAFGQGGMGGMGGGRGHGGMGGPRGSDHRKSSSDDKGGVALLPQPPVLMPHGGEYLTTKTDHCELVYMPLQARIYLFDDKMKPLTARDVHAEMSLNVPPQNTPQKIPFQYIAKSAMANDQDYLVAAFDFRQLPDKETPITIECSGLPESKKFLGFWDRHNEAASFTPSFRPSKIRPYVARGLLTEADQEGFRRQHVCPVSGRVLGIEGQAIKLYVGDYPLYLAGEDCIAAVKQSPEKYLPQPATPIPGR